MGIPGWGEEGSWDNKDSVTNMKITGFGDSHEETASVTLHVRCGHQGSRFTGEETACLSLLVMDEVVMVGKWLAPDGKCKECGRETVSPLLNAVMSPSQAMISQD